MRKLLKVVLFEPDVILLGRMTAYWSEVDECSFLYESYTAEEQLRENIPLIDADLWLIDESMYDEVATIVGKDRTLNFTKRPKEDADTIFKYQSIEVITAMIGERLGVPQYHHSDTHQQLYIFYTPSRCSMETPMALEFAQSLSQKYKTLYIQLKPYSDLEYRTNQIFTKDISDLLFYLENSTNHSPIQIQKHMLTFNATDIIIAPRHVENLLEIHIDQWLTLLETVSNIYEAIVLEMSDSVRGIYSLLQQANCVITLSDKSEISSKEVGAYFYNLEQLREKKIMDHTVSLYVECGEYMGGYAAQQQYIKQNKLMDTLLEKVEIYGGERLRSNIPVSEGRNTYQSYRSIT